MDPTHELLVVDDDPVIRQLMCDVFDSHGNGHDYNVQVTDSAQAARCQLEAAIPDLVILDIGLPGEDGLSLARFIREHHDIPIIIVSGAGEPIDRILGLEIGADDYLVKPFEPRELLARVRSVLRRYRRNGQQAPPASATSSIGPLRLDREGRRLTAEDGSDIELTRMEFDLLLALVDHAGRVLSRDQLLNMTQNREWDPFDRSIDIRIARLRRKLGAHPGCDDLIRTVRGVGYTFAPRKP
jgi:DNA-binding response OmpR family regulator